MNLIQTVLIAIGSLLIIYAFICFIAHYLDFGWRLVYGEWLHTHAGIVKKLRTGIFHKLLIVMLLTVVVYGGLRQLLAFIPTDWGRMNRDGEFYSYRNSFFSILSLLLSGITMYGFSMADRTSEKDKEPNV